MYLHSALYLLHFLYLCWQVRPSEKNIFTKLPVLFLHVVEVDQGRHVNTQTIWVNYQLLKTGKYKDPGAELFGAKNEAI